MFMKTLKVAAKIAITLAPNDPDPDVPPTGENLYFYQDWYSRRNLKFNYYVRECPYTGEEEVTITHVW